MDGGCLPERPEGLLSDEMLGDRDGGYLFIGTKGKIMGDYNMAPVLLPSSRMKETLPAQTIPGYLGIEAAHYTTWVEACLKGYGNMQLSSPFDYAGPMTEAVLMGTWHCAVTVCVVRMVKDIQAERS